MLQYGQAYVCEGCGLELKAVKACQDAGRPEKEYACEIHGGFECCGQPLKLKED